MLMRLEIKKPPPTQGGGFLCLFLQIEGLLGLDQLADHLVIGRGNSSLFAADTGYPADSDLMSVTVVADAAGSGEGGAKLPGNGTMCDALSTALFVMGEEQALDFWRDRTQEFDLILVTGDGRVVVTSGIADSFTPRSCSKYMCDCGNYYDYRDALSGKNPYGSFY